MRHRKFSLGRILIFLLAVGSPLVFYQGYRNQRELIKKDAAIKASLSRERHQIVRQICYRFFSEPERLEAFHLKRHMPAGPLLGLAQAPTRERLETLSPFERSDQRSSASALLQNPERYFSGMPKRYAGLIEMLKTGMPPRTDPVSDELYRVFCQFWQGLDLNNSQFLFLIRKLPEPLAVLFSQQLLFLEDPQTVDDLPADGKFLVNIQKDEVQYLLRMPQASLQELNRALRALQLDTVFTTAKQWLRWEQLGLTLNPRPMPSSKLLRRTAFFYSGACLGVELILLLILGVLIQYERADSAQRKLLAATSHELRTPLAVIRQFAEILSDRQQTFAEKYRQYHRFILHECMKMQFLVENLLETARFENLKPRLNRERFRLKPWLEERAHSFSLMDPARTIRIQCPDLWVCWDATLWERVWVNLIENVRIHAGTPVDVAVIQENHTVTMSLRDYGKKLNFNDFDRIKAFKPGAASKSGLGLGLFLVKRIVEAHGGTLGFENADPGLRVLIQLPQNLGTT